MKKRSLTMLLLGVAVTLQAQMVINGHKVPYDNETNTWLATIPETLFGHDNALPLTLEEGWQQVVINGQTVDSQYTFEQITAQSIYPVTLTDNQGQTRTGNLQFTFLPVVQLQGEFSLEYQDGTVVVADPETAVDSVLEARVKWRGGTTNRDGKHKRNYNIKFANDVKLFGLRNDNNWMLDAGQPDVFRLRNRIAMDIWNDIGSKPYYINQEPKALNGVRGCVVEVFLNDDYRGIYNLSEKLDRKQMKLKKADNAGGVHGILYKGVSWVGTMMGDSITEYNNKSNNLLGYEMKYPEVGDDNDSTDWKPLADAINRILFLYYDDQAFEQEIAQWVDIPVMIDYSIFLSATGAYDNNGKNMFWAIYDKSISQMITLAPWDLDCTFGQRWGGMLTEGKNIASSQYLDDVLIEAFYSFYRNNALQFNNRLNERYQELRQPGGVLSTESLTERFTRYYRKLKNSGAATREENKWSGDSDVWGDVIDFDQEYAYICDWIASHMELIDRQGFPVRYNKEFWDSMTGIQLAQHRPYACHVYTLSGQRIDHTSDLRPGIYIVNNKKVVVRR